MKSREAAARLKRFEAQEKARKVQGLEHMIREFEQMAADLDRQVQAEEDRTGVKDRNHFAYSTFAKAAFQRREKLAASIDDLKAKLRDATRERDDALNEADAGVALEVKDVERGRRRGDRQPAATVS